MKPDAPAHPQSNSQKLNHRIEANHVQSLRFAIYTLLGTSFVRFRDCNENLQLLKLRDFNYAQTRHKLR